MTKTSKPKPKQEEFYGCIYIIRNTTNAKVYVGKTIRDVQRRLVEHKSRLSNGNTRPFYQAMINDGVKEIFLEVVDDKIPSELLKEKEIYYMDQYDSVKNGYNFKRGDRSLLLPGRELADLYQYGMTLKEIGQMYGGADKSSVQLRIVELGIEIRDWNQAQYVDGMTESVLIDLYEVQQLTTYEIGDMFNTSDVTVSKRLKKYNIPLRRAVNRKYL